MKLIYLLIPFFLLGCSSQRPMAEIQPHDPPATVPGTALGLPSADQVRHSEALKAYPVGRYEDPNDPTVMHEAHLIYRAEQPPSWDFDPTVGTVVPLGPTVAVNNPARDDAGMTGELEQKIQQQNQLLQATFEQNQQLANELKKLQDDIAQTRGLASANDALQKRVTDLQTEVSTLQRDLAAPSHPATPKPTDPKSSWWSWCESWLSTPTPTSTSAPNNPNPTKGKK